MNRINDVEWVTMLGGSLVVVPLPNNGTAMRPSEQRAPESEKGTRMV